MNIFVTSPCPIESAKALDDKRVVKMCSESVQLLCTALVSRGVPQHELPMKPTHVNHPCNIWVRSSRSNYLWLCDHLEALCGEKLARYPSNPPYMYSGCMERLRGYVGLFGDIGLTPFVNCAANADMGISYKHVKDVHLAYQLYLNDRLDLDKRTPTWYGIQ